MICSVRASVRYYVSVRMFEHVNDMSDFATLTMNKDSSHKHAYSRNGASIWNLNMYMHMYSRNDDTVVLQAFMNYPSRLPLMIANCTGSHYTTTGRVTYVTWYVRTYVWTEWLDGREHVPRDRILLESQLQ
jgi:hypothetical protein